MKMSQNQDLNNGLAIAGEILKQAGTVLSESKHKRTQCMSCDKPPTKEVLWAEGMGHAWFCEACLKEWSKDHEGDIDYIKEVKDGEASMKFKDNPNPNIKESIFDFTLHHRWWPARLCEGVSVMDQKFDLRIDMKDRILQVSSNQPLEASNDKVILAENLDRTWQNKGATVEKLIEVMPTDITKTDISWLSKLDSGKAELIESTDNLFKFKLISEKIDKVIVLKRESEHNMLWSLSED